MKFAAEGGKINFLLFLIFEHGPSLPESVMNYLKYEVRARGIDNGWSMMFLKLQSLKLWSSYVASDHLKKNPVNDVF